MDALLPYALPIKGLSVGIHRYDFHIDRSFFEHFEGSPIEDAAVDVQLLFDKRLDMFVLDFTIAGTVRTECDRCLADIDLPIADQQQLVVKYSHEAPAEEAEIVYIRPEVETFNVAKYIYEYIVLSMPIIKVYDCEEETVRPCDMSMLERLNGEDDETRQESTNPIWDELRKLTDNDN